MPDPSSPDTADDDERKAKRSAYVRAWRAANAEKLKAQQAAYHAAKAEKLRARKAAYY